MDQDYEDKKGSEESSSTDQMSVSDSTEFKDDSSSLADNTTTAGSEVTENIPALESVEKGKGGQMSASTTKEHPVQESVILTENVNTIFSQSHEKINVVPETKQTKMCASSTDKLSQMTIVEHLPHGAKVILVQPKSAINVEQFKDEKHSTNLEQTLPMKEILGANASRDLNVPLSIDVEIEMDDAFEEQTNDFAPVFPTSRDGEMRIISFHDFPIVHSKVKAAIIEPYLMQQAEADEGECIDMVQNLKDPQHEIDIETLHRKGSRSKSVVRPLVSSESSFSFSLDSPERRTLEKSVTSAELASCSSKSGIDFQLASLNYIVRELKDQPINEFIPPPVIEPKIHILSTAMSADTSEKSSSPEEVLPSNADSSDGSTMETLRSQRKRLATEENILVAVSELQVAVEAIKRQQKRTKVIAEFFYMKNGLFYTVLSTSLSGATTASAIIGTQQPETQPVCYTLVAFCGVGAAYAFSHMVKILRRICRSRRQMYV